MTVNNNACVDSIYVLCVMKLLHGGQQGRVVCTAYIMTEPSVKCTRVVDVRTCVMLQTTP